jgi:magnesium transporter
MQREKGFSLSTVLLPEVKEAIEEGRFDEVKAFLQEVRPQDIVDLMEELDPPKRVILFRLLDKEKAADVFSELPLDLRERFLRGFTQEETRTILRDLDPDDRVRLFDELPREVVKNLMALLPKEERDQVLLLLNFPQGSAGHVMSPHFVEVKEDMTVGEALRAIREQRPTPEASLMAFVLDEEGKLKGTVDLTDLVLSDEDTRVRDIMQGDIPVVRADEDREVAAKILQKYDLFAVPVVDSVGRLLGVITVDDVFFFFL